MPRSSTVTVMEGRAEFGGGGRAPRWAAGGSAAAPGPFPSHGVSVVGAAGMHAVTKPSWGPKVYKTEVPVHTVVKRVGNKKKWYWCEVNYWKIMGSSVSCLRICSWDKPLSLQTEANTFFFPSGGRKRSFSGMKFSKCLCEFMIAF